MLLSLFGAGAGLVSFLLLRAGYGFLVWGLLPFLALILAALVLVAGIWWLSGATCRASGSPVIPRRSRARIRSVADHAVGMMYSRELMDDGREMDAGRLEERLSELEKLAEDLEGVPDSEVVGILDRAVALLAEVNARIEAGLSEAEGEARELGDLLEKIDFGPFDAALEDLEDLEQPSGGPGGG